MNASDPRRLQAAPGGWLVDGPLMILTWAYAMLSIQGKFLPRGNSPKPGFPMWFQTCLLDLPQMPETAAGRPPKERPEAPAPGINGGSSKN